VMCVAPLSANTLAKLAAGLADNLLTSAALALRAPLVIAPAMNDAMWEHPATRANLATLEERGARVVPPGEGALASRGEWGVGRLAEPPEILQAVEEALAGGYAPRSLDGLRVVVTAGGTHEPIDPVRFVGNRSSGRMGWALAEEAARRGAEVVVVAANVALPRVEGIAYRDVETAAELAAATKEAWASADVVLMAAAVADFRPRRAEQGKLAREGRDGLTVELEPTEDVLRALAEVRRPGQTLVGFAAEHGPGAEERARRKLERKGLDLLVLNDVAVKGIGFGAEENEVALLTPDGTRHLPKAPKGEVARAVWDAVEGVRERIAL
jgi:phosphopantothenoylcysteine decarboxylase / phosphopantothenate---cysteine ligase